VTHTQALVLGLVQGLTEFLPVSSSGHLILVPHLFGWPDQGLAFDAAMHLGTLLALVAYFRAELIALATGALRRRVGVLIVLATIPGAVAGVLLDRWIEAHLRSPLVVAAATAFWGVVMWIADRAARPPAADPEPLERVSGPQALTIGIAQALALIPGTSRSGITMTAGLFSGLDRPTAARFSFLLGIPITGGAGSLKLFHLLREGLAPGQAGPLALAVLCAFIAGWFAVWFLVSYLQTHSLRPFVIYRLAIAAAVVYFVLR
jgi:undecaprenyl-diphosphatase